MFPFVIECITFLASVNIFTTETIRNQYIYQTVAESYNYTANKSEQLCSVNSSIRSKEEEIVANDVSRWSIYFDLASGLTALVSTWLLTSWSDKVGRKIPLAISLTGLLLSSILDSFVVAFGLPIYVLVIDGAISGITGNFPSVLYLSLAYLSDTTKREDKSTRFTIIESTMGLGGGLSALGTGFWITSQGFAPSSIMAATCCALALILVPLLSVKDSHTHDHMVNAEIPDKPQERPDYGSLTSNEGSAIAEKAERETAKHTESFAKRMKSLWQVLSTETSKCSTCNEDDIIGMCNHGGGRHRGRVWRLWFYLLAFAFYVYALVGPSYSQTMYFLSYPLCFNSILIGGQNGLRLCTVGLAPFLVTFYRSVLHISNNTIILSAIVFRFSLTLLLCFATETYLVFIATGIAVFSNITTPFIRSQISCQVSASEQGTTLGFVSVIESFTDMLAMVSFLTIYPATLRIFHGFMWFYAALILIIPLALMMIVWIANKRRLSQTQHEDRAALLIN